MGGVHSVDATQVCRDEERSELEGTALSVLTSLGSNLQL